MFSGKVARVNRHILMQAIEPEDVIRIHPASVRGCNYLSTPNVA